VLLASTGQTQEQIAKAAGVSRVTVNHWCSGATKPLPEKRTILREKFDIPDESWEESPEKRSAKKVSEAALVPIPRGVHGKAAALEQMAEQLLLEVQVKGQSTPHERARVMSSIAATLQRLSKLSRDYQHGTDVMTWPFWKKIEAALEEALTPYPDAAKAVSVAFGELRGESD
jgi:transcriptional regulator with XRE-family HTH domain